MSTQWYYQVRGESSSLVMGPVSLEVLGRLMQRGYIPPDSLVREGSGDWVLAQSLNHLFDVTTDSQPTDSQAADQAHYATVEDVRFVPETPPQEPPTYAPPPPPQPTTETAPPARRKRRAARSWKSIGGFLAGVCVGAVLGLVIGLVIARFQSPQQVSQLPPPPPAVPTAEIDQKAVASFEDFVTEQVRQIRELEDVEYGLETDDGTKGTFKVEIGDEFSCDCRKNNSLLTPVTGVIYLKRRRILTYYERLGELRIPQMWKDLKVDCSYRNGRWQCNTDVKQALGIQE